MTDPSNRYLFVSNLRDDVILQYRFDETSGAVTLNEPGFVATRKGAGPRHFVFHPDGHRVFGTNELDGTVSSYRLNSSGTLTLLLLCLLMAEEFGQHIPKGDVYFAMGFSVFVELLNIRARRRTSEPVHLRQPYAVEG